jgi:hypothetical protein
MFLFSLSDLIMEDFYTQRDSEKFCKSFNEIFSMSEQTILSFRNNYDGIIEVLGNVLEFYYGLELTLTDDSSPDGMSSSESSE